jgi:CubicO group peptidase (beta-lactamase class C family)
VCALIGGVTVAAFAQSTTPTTAPTLAQQRRDFQTQELITGKSSSYIFNVGETPRIVWRDLEHVRELGSDGKLRIRWFDANLNEAALPNHPGRWGALAESTAPNGTPVRRAMTFYARAPGESIFWPKPYTVPLPAGLGGRVWKEHENEIALVAGDGAFRAMNDSEAGAILVAGLSEMEALGRPPFSFESAAARNDAFQLAIKLKTLGLDKRIKPLAPPRNTDGPPAPMIREGSLAEAGMRDDAKERIEAVCRDWAKDSGEPFVTFVARHGVIVVHDSFGIDKISGKPLPLDFRSEVASITKSTTAVLFARFLDDGLLDLDESVADVFPDYPHDPAHVPTFRQCLTHTSGLAGHGEFNGARNPHFDNVVLNGIDVNTPGKKYEYSGMGFDLTAAAMQIVSGKSMLRMYHEDLFEPLGIGDVPLKNASSGAQYDVKQLATIAQLLANHGSYGDREFFSARTFEKLLPEDLSTRYPGVNETEGIGIHWMQTAQPWMHTAEPGKPPDSKDPADWILGKHTIGHGSLTACVFLIDLDNDLVITQIRREAGPRYAEWSAKFLQTIADSVTP